MLEFSPVTVPGAVDLSVNIGALRLSNPIIAASGTFGYGVEFAHLVNLNRLGGIVVKGLSLEPIAGAPAPRLCETPSGMLNAVGLQNIGVRAFIAEKLPALRAFNAAIIANVFGYTVDEYVGVIRVLEEAEGLAAYELNISCPNTAHGGIQFGSDPQMVSEVVGSARRAASRPLWVKLSPNVTDIAFDCPRSRKCRCGRPDRGQYISGHERRHTDTEVEAWADFRRSLGPRNQADHTPAGLRG